MAVITNTAFAQGTNTGDTPFQGSAPITVFADPTLTVTKTANPNDELNVGDKFVYTIIVTNNGPGVAKNVTFTDDAPTGVSFDGTASSTKGSVTTNTSSKVVVNIGDINNKQSVTVTIPATVVSIPPA